MTDRDLEKLLQRISDLERANRRLKLWLIIVGVLALIGIALSCTPRRTPIAAAAERLAPAPLPKPENVQRVIRRGNNVTVTTGGTVNKIVFGRTEIILREIDE